MKNIFLFLVLVFFYCLIGCDKNLPSQNLPPITEEGKNTIGFLVDGEVWVPYAECGFFQNPCMELSVWYGPPHENPNKFSFYAGKRLTNESILTSIIVTSRIPIKEPGNYYDSVSIIFHSDKIDPTTGHPIKYQKNDMFSGEFNITRLDTVSQIIAGNFNFTLVGKDNETIEITDGRFDFKIGACICR